MAVSRTVILSSQASQDWKAESGSIVEYMLGNPFPVYVGAANCGGTWRVNYDLYYVHDGVMLEGHKHDWEGATVVCRADPNKYALFIFSEGGW